jgi:uncharacterized protein
LYIRLNAYLNESKRRANLDQHGLDFAGCEAVFDSPVLTCEDDREANGEQRLVLIGWLDPHFVQMTYTERDGDVHVICLRQATSHEIEAFCKSLSRSQA